MIRHSKLALAVAVASLAFLPAAFAAPADTPAAPASTAAAAAPAAKAATGKPASGVHKVSAKQAAQRQKMKDCSAQAKTKSLKGADRKTFMSTCLKG